MSMRAIAVVIFLCLTALVLYGCNREAAQPAPGSDGSGAAGADQAAAGDQPAADETPEQMVERWKKLAATATRENPLLVETATLANEIAARDFNALMSLLDLVDSSESTPYVKVLATLSLSPIVGQHMTPRLLEMVKPEKDGTTRACATNLLRQIPTDEVVAVLRQLKLDPEPRVRIYAQIGVAMSDPQERKELYAVWHKPEMSLDEKGTIIDALTQRPVLEDLPLMQEAASATDLHEGIRASAVKAIGQLGSSEQVPVLTTFSQNDPSEKVKVAARAALDELNGRLNGTSQLTLPLQ